MSGCRQQGTLTESCDALALKLAGLKTAVSTLAERDWSGLQNVENDYEAIDHSVAECQNRVAALKSAVCLRAQEEETLRMRQTQEISKAIFTDFPGPTAAAEEVEAHLEYLPRLANLVYDLEMLRRKRDEPRPLPADLAEVIGPGSQNTRLKQK